MLMSRMSGTIDADWLRVVPLCVGRSPSGAGTPVCFVTVAENDDPVLRVDVYAHEPDCYAFQEAIIWRDNLIVGFGSYVHAISISRRSASTVALESYFGHIYSADEYLLLASGERLFRMEVDRSILWRSDHLGIDGVVVHEAGQDVIRGEGEWDPPGGWRPFAILAADGSPA